MLKHFYAFLIFGGLCVSSFAAGSSKIKVYFNTAVDTSYATPGNNAAYLYRAMDDTLIAYINRANHTLDIAVYQFSQGSGMSDIAGALNAAYSRGVRIRFIYDGQDSASTSMGLLNGSIAILASPSTSAYNIMHNKFMVIDAGYAADATVWSGSTNWTESMFDRSTNNAVVIQDQAVAQAYLAQFEMMWGGSGATPNAAASKFGPFKTASATNSFTVDGRAIEVYFSPADNTNTHIRSTIQAADKEIFFGVYTYTESPNAHDMKVKYNTPGVTVKGIMDEYSFNYNAYDTLAPVMGNDLKIYNGSNTVYHNKMMIADPDYPTLDPLVLTGSHNWSVTADTKNDENMIIIHDADIANQYLQAFAASFAALGGSVSHVTAVSEAAQDDRISIYPNPVKDVLWIDAKDAGPATAEITTLAGQRLRSVALHGGRSMLSLSDIAPGMYIVSVSDISGLYTYKIVKI